MRYQTIGVVGAGVVGAGVAQSLAQTGHRVVLVDVAAEILERARDNIGNGLRHAALFDPVLREADHRAILARIEPATDLERLAPVDFLIENVTESWPLKREVYPRLDRSCGQDCIFAANTSAISIARLAGTTRRPDRVIGMHFMNPVPRKPVVEVIRSAHTSAATVEGSLALLEQMGKRAIVVKDMPGFVSNRVLMLAINEAIHIVHDGVADPAGVDAIFVKCFAHKMGPLATADLIGLDTILNTLEVLHKSYGGTKFRPCPLLIQMVEAGRLGRKSGSGFFDYATARRA